MGKPKRGVATLRRDQCKGRYKFTSVKGQTGKSLYKWRSRESDHALGLWRRISFGVCRRGVIVSDLWRRNYAGVSRRSGSGSDLWRRRYSGVCRGGVTVSDLWRRN